jgi:cytochrome c556
MFKKMTFLAASACCVIAVPAPAMAQGSTEVATVAEMMPLAPAESARLKLAEQTAAKLIPDGTYQKLMKDMADKMASNMINQMLGMDASAIAGSPDTNATDGKTLADIAAEKDPNFKERLDVTMKVMFTEMGALMNNMEPVVRFALAKTYARKYNEKQLSDMNVFFSSPSGSVFAADFMSSFTDKEVMDATISLTPMMMQAMPAILKKVEAATAHLPPLPKSSAEQYASQSEEDDANETGEEPWHNPESWTASQRKKIEALASANDAAMAKSTKLYDAYSAANKAAVDAARKKLKPQYDALNNDSNPVPAEDIPANAPSPPMIPNT